MTQFQDAGNFTVFFTTNPAIDGYEVIQKRDGRRVGTRATLKSASGMAYAMNCEANNALAKRRRKAALG